MFAFVPLALASLVLAAPSNGGGGKSVCDLSNTRLQLPQGQTALTVPTTAPTFVGLAIGWQNYTCDATTHKYTSAGAIAELADASCLPQRGFTFAKASQGAYEDWLAVQMSETRKVLLGDVHAPILGQHYFVKNTVSGSGIIARWDFTAPGDVRAGDHDAFVDASRVASIPAPTGPQDVDWVQLKRQDGKLADTVYRTDTRGGQPPTDCSPGLDSTISVKYSSIYWFFG